VLPNKSAGILPILDTEVSPVVWGAPVNVINDPSVTPPVDAVTGITVTPATVSIAVGSTVTPQVVVTGTGTFDTGWTAASSATGVATVSDSGTITGVAAGTATITYTSIGDTSITATVAVTVA